MKYFRLHLRANKQVLKSVIIISVAINIMILVIDMNNFGEDGFIWPIVIGLLIAAVLISLILLLILRESKRNERLYDILNEKGVCDELIEAYKMRHPRMTPMQHVVLSNYLKVLGRYEQAEYELSIAGNYYMADAMTKAWYSEGFIDLRIIQRRFDEAIIMYNNYSSMMNAYCRTHKDAISVEHYAHGALLYAYSGDFNSAMVCIQSMDKPLRKNRKLAFTRNTALMGIYLIKGDLANADKVKSMMLSDAESFDGFDLKYEKALILKDIDNISDLFDVRRRNREQEDQAVRMPMNSQQVQNIQR